MFLLRTSPESFVFHSHSDYALHGSNSALQPWAAMAVLSWLCSWCGAIDLSLLPDQIIRFSAVQLGLNAG